MAVVAVLYHCLQYVATTAVLYAHVIAVALATSHCVPVCESYSLSLSTATGQIVSVGDPHKKYTKMEKIGQG